MIFPLDYHCSFPLVTKFFTSAKIRGLSIEKSYALFVHGLDLEGNMVTDADHKERG